MYRKILVPLDGSEIADIALIYAAETAVALPGAEIDLLHVYNPMESGLGSMHKAYIENAADEIRKRLDKNAAVKVKSQLMSGDPADEIVRYTQKQKKDLIIMATHGRSGISRWAMGSVAYKVMRSVKIPICLVRAGIDEETICRKAKGNVIIVPLDGSKKAESVLPYVKALVQQYNKDDIEVVLLRVCAKPEISSDYPYSMPMSWEEHVEQEQIKCKLVAGVYLAELAKQFKSADIEVRMELPIGKPAKEIIKYDAQSDSRVIIMSTHGRSGISRWAYGSIAESVMLGTQTPVIMIGQQ
jgi:nucleotide-binding universal stress UspA family protein